MTEFQIELLIKKINEGISKNYKIVDFLMDTLDIGRESVYRRLRGEIPFTFDEICTLSLKVGFSVDEIIGKNTNSRIIISLRDTSESDHEETFTAMLKEYYRYVDIISNAEEIEVLATINRLSLFLIIEYDNLFKLFYYNWIHQTYSTSVNDTFGETIIPDEIVELRNKFLGTKNLLKNVSFIIDREIFLNVVRKIQYYYSRRLFTDQEIDTIKGELEMFIAKLKNILQTGTDEHGTIFNFYLSLLDVETNTNCAIYDSDNIASLYWLFPTKPIVIINQDICAMQKKWLESSKKYSILITQSNELLQENFLDKQQKYIDSIKNELFYY
jgi:hypothetical protein